MNYRSCRAAVVPANRPPRPSLFDALGLPVRDRPAAAATGREARPSRIPTAGCPRSPDDLLDLLGHDGLRLIGEGWLAFRGLGLLRLRLRGRRLSGGAGAVSAEVSRLSAEGAPGAVSAGGAGVSAAGGAGVAAGGAGVSAEGAGRSRPEARASRLAVRSAAQPPASSAGFSRPELPRPPRAEVPGCRHSSAGRR